MRVVAKPVEPMVRVEITDAQRPRAPDVHSDSTACAPIASGAELAKKAAPLDGVPITNAIGVRCVTGAAIGAGTVDGMRVLAKRFDEIERMTNAGVRVRCVFDLDNTIFDTRHRTLFCAQEFARQNPESAAWFDGVTADMMKVDGRDTAIALGAPDDVIERFAAFWQREFWRSKNLAHDVPIQAMVDVVNECKRRGADVCFLTGRCDKFVHPNAPERGEDSFRAATHAQLKQAGIDVDDDALALKPRLGIPTSQFKQGQMQAWELDSEIGLFLTEGRRDLDLLQGQIPALACFRLDCSFEERGPSLPNIPTLPRAF